MQFPLQLAVASGGLPPAEAPFSSITSLCTFVLLLISATIIPTMEPR